MIQVGEPGGLLMSLKNEFILKKAIMWPGNCSSFSLKKPRENSGFFKAKPIEKHRYFNL